jgi:hypothetical protein
VLSATINDTRSHSKVRKQVVVMVSKMAWTLVAAPMIWLTFRSAMSRSLWRRMRST